MKDLFNAITVARAIAPVSVSDNTAQVSQIIDRQGFGSLTFAVATGSLADADATFSVLVEHGDAANLSDGEAVEDDALLGSETLAGFGYADDNETRKIGYAGDKRYVRLTVTPSGNGAAALIAAVAVLGHAELQPTGNP